MNQAVVQDWTETQVLLKFNDHRDVRYRVYRDGDRHFQEIQDPAGTPIHTLELPHGMRLDKASYEVLLRYVLLDVVAAA
jgi:hypothetical protein